MKKSALFIASGLAAMVAVAPASAQEFSFKFPHVVAAADPLNQAAEYYAKIVGERSNGRIAIEVVPGGQLGSNQELYEQVKLGAPLVIFADPGYLSDYVPDFGILGGPYLLDQPGDFAKILKSDLFADLGTRLHDDTAYQLLSLNWYFGDRDIIANKAIRTPADIAGVSIRVPPNTMWIKTFEAMGARGEQLAWPEVYGALASGVVDAAEAPLGTIYGSKLQESAKTISMTGHFYAWIGVIMNKDIFAGIPPELQKVMLDAAIDAGNYLTDSVQKAQTDYIAKFRSEGVTVVEDIDRAAFRKSTESVYSAFPKWTPGLYDKVRAILTQ